MTMEKRIPFNKPYLTGKEMDYIKDAVYSGKISGNGKYTHRCHALFREQYGFNKCLLTTSCTDALEMTAIRMDIKRGDEVILPSYTFVSTANAYALHGAKLIFTDSRTDHPGMDEDAVERLITSNTKAIVVVHYAGMAVNMDKITDIASRHGLYVIEDAAQAVDSYYINPKQERQPLGSIGHMGCFSFHETKNVISGEGGMLVVNDQRLEKRAEIIWEKGTNRSEFFRGEVNKYGWVDVGSSFLPTDMVAAFLYAQLEHLDEIQQKRKDLWNTDYRNLKSLNSKKFHLPNIPTHATNNGHLFYLVCRSGAIRDNLIQYLKDNQIQAVFHYLSLHKSPYYKNKYQGEALPNSDLYSERLVRLPLYNELTVEQVNTITDLIADFDERF